jgi:hypothetical protein
MGSTNPSKRHAEKKIETELGSIDLAKKPSRQWKLLDFISLTMMAGIVILFLLIFTSLGDSLAASGQLYLDHEESAAAQLQLAGAKTSSSGNESLSLSLQSRRLLHLIYTQSVCSCKCMYRTWLPAAAAIVLLLRPPQAIMPSSPVRFPVMEGLWSLHFFYSSEL